jgi:hypothetical protein
MQASVEEAAGFLFADATDCLTGWEMVVLA